MSREIVLGLMIVHLLTLHSALADSTRLSGKPESVPALSSDAFSSPEVKSALVTAAADSLYLLGGPGDLTGKFENTLGLPAWNGWVSVDATAFGKWQCSDYFAEELDPSQPANKAWWCGLYYPACDIADYDGGYGNDWSTSLDWKSEAPDPSASTSILITFTMNYDMELAYDRLELQYHRSGSYETLASWDGSSAGPYHGSVSFTMLAGEYEDGDQVHLRFLFTSDRSFSDEDCVRPSHGACQIDLISVYFEDVLQGTIEDCDINPRQWYQGEGNAVGDFTKLWSNLPDIDPCADNITPALAFIDDESDPNPAGYPCTTWCYGPGGFIVNPAGGLMGGNYGIRNEVWSPVIACPAGSFDRALLRFDVYRHEDLGFMNFPGMLYYWEIRTTTSEDPADILLKDWRSDGLSQYGGPDWKSFSKEIRKSIQVQDARHVQIALGVYDDQSFYFGTDGTPAPYFDNVQLIALDFDGPRIAAYENRLFQDNFPTEGALDLTPGNEWRNSIRLDMAANLESWPSTANVPGDSIVVVVEPVRSGSSITEEPELHYKLFRNPSGLFDVARLPGMPDEGFITGTLAFISADEEHYYWFDLPDDYFFFPGDILHYFIKARDNQNGNTGTTMVPADTTGFSLKSGAGGYPLSFTVRGLPTVFSRDAGAQPKYLLWVDGSGPENPGRILDENGFIEQTHYDIYYTNAPGSGLGNGLGGRATESLISAYERIIYLSGNQSRATLSDGDQVDAGDDIGLLTAWLANPDHALLLSGNHIAQDLVEGGTLAGLDFLLYTMGAGYNGSDVGLNLGTLTEINRFPHLAAITDAPAFHEVSEWRLMGGCPDLRIFDAVVPFPPAVSMAEFLNLDCNGGIYPYSGAILNGGSGYLGNQTLYFPFDLYSVSESECQGSGGNPQISVAARLLQDALIYFRGVSTGVPRQPGLYVKCFPNPFNPRTRIEYGVPRKGLLKLKIYDVQGKLTRTLINGTVDPGSSLIVWDGTDDQGRQVSSGVYFVQISAHGAKHHQKITLIR